MARLARVCCLPATVWSLLIFSAVALFAQMNTAEIAGDVRDPSGAVVPGARVVATQAATQRSYTALTNDSGQFLLAQLPVGEYTLTVDAQGFRRVVLPGVVLYVGGRLQHEFVLAVGEQSETVVVEGGVGPLQLESAEIKDVIQQEQVAALPLKARQFLDLAMLSEAWSAPREGRAETPCSRPVRWSIFWGSAAGTTSI